LEDEHTDPVVRPDGNSPNSYLNVLANVSVGALEYLGARLTVETLGDDTGKALTIFKKVSYVNAQGLIFEQAFLWAVERQNLGRCAVARKDRALRIDGHNSNRNGL
jgi:hypothetical protein